MKQWPNAQRQQRARPPARPTSRATSTKKRSGRISRPLNCRSSFPTTTRRSKNCAGRAILISIRSLSGAARIFESDPLEVDAPPIYIQEKIQPRAIIEDLRRQTKERRADDASQFDFFHDFNGLADPEAKTEFYAHDQNWSNRMILEDSLLVMASLAEREALRGKVQCIYMDPPYGIKFNSNWQPSTKSRKVEDTKKESVSREPEVIRAFRDTWKDEIHSYLNDLRDRLVVSRDLLSRHRLHILTDRIGEPPHCARPNGRGIRTQKSRFGDHIPEDGRAVQRLARRRKRLFNLVR